MSTEASDEATASSSTSSWSPFTPSFLTKEKCEKAVDKALQRAPAVKYLFEKLNEAGCSVDRSFIKVENCTTGRLKRDEEFSGGLVPGEGIVVCHERMIDQVDVDVLLTHELVHAYDHCRAKNLDWSNCEHHACSEIRAANLSGDCNMMHEICRGNLNLVGQQVKCVKRRAAISVAGNPCCQRPGVARAAVEKVFDACYHDSAPFDRPYW